MAAVVAGVLEALKSFVCVGHFETRDGSRDAVVEYVGVVVDGAGKRHSESVARLKECPVSCAEEVERQAVGIGVASFEARRIHDARESIHRHHRHHPYPSPSH
jgi:hypothetical protein